MSDLGLAKVSRGLALSFSTGQGDRGTAVYMGMRLCKSVLKESSEERD